MLTDEEKQEIIDKYHTDKNYDLWDAFDAIERAVLAKSLAQQERLHKEWSELWNPIDDAVRPLTPLGESVAAKALELINMAKAMPIPKQEPVGKMIVSKSKGSCICYDFSWIKSPETGKIMASYLSDGIYNCYAYPQPAQAAAIPEAMKHLTDSGGYYDDCYINGWNACREAMISASTKPE